MRRSARRVSLPLALAALFLGASPASARIVSYGHIAPTQSVPAIQKRAARHVVVREKAGIERSDFEYWYLWRIVVHDSLGLEPPRDITPGGSPRRVERVAALEEQDGTFRILVISASSFLYSADGGATWKTVAMPVGAYLFGAQSTGFAASRSEFGGPVFGATSSPLRLGNAETPFVLAVASSDTNRSGFWAIGADGSARMLSIASGWWQILGSDLSGTRFLVGAYFFAPWPSDWYASRRWKVAVLDLAGNLQPLFDVSFAPNDSWPAMEGWITPDGAAYFTVNWPSSAIVASPPPLRSAQSVAMWRSGTLRELVSSTATSSQHVLAVPTPDFAGAWIAAMGAADTALLSHSGDGPVTEVWRDVSRPFVSSMHAAASGSRLLIQTRRLQGLREWKGLAVWRVGEPPPPSYDELVVRIGLEGMGFVHLDVDAVAEGAPFLFDTGADLPPLGGPSASTSGGSGGGADVYQSGGVVRAALSQRLAIPASARVPGRSGAAWRTDVILRNPESEPVKLDVRLLPSSEMASSADAAVLLAARSIQVIPDALSTLFHVEKGSGALLLLPEPGRSIEAASRTYTQSASGTYGMGVGSVDLLTAAGPGFPLTFAAGLIGEGFRTNLVATDAAATGPGLDVLLSTADGQREVLIASSIPANGQTQLNDLASISEAAASTVGSLTVTPRSGRVLAGDIVIDNRTNDPAWFGPDSVPDVLWTRSLIPAVVHAEGANDARYRSDLFLFNADDKPVTARLSARDWYSDEDAKTVNVALSGREARSIPDVLGTLFGRTGVARLSITVPDTGRLGVRATSRTYVLTSDGSTYGTPVPALGPLQTAGGGDTLEILGPTGGANFRTNLSLVHLGERYSLTVVAYVEILGSSGEVVDAFETSIPGGRGVQFNDLFRARALGDGPAAALIRVTVSCATEVPSLAAYATTIDNGTNDSIYFGANLSARSTDSAIAGLTSR